MSKKSFNRETHRLQATRVFQHGLVAGVAGEVLSDADHSALTDSEIDHLLNVAEVVVPVSAAASDKGGKSDKTDKP